MITTVPDNVRAIGLEAGKGPDQIETDLRRALGEGQPTLVLVDIPGGSPARVAASLLGTANVQVVSGLNLAMLVEASYAPPEMDLVSLAAQVQEAGAASIVNIADQLKSFS